MTKQVHISVVVPAYNSGEMLARTIKSLQQQTISPDKLEIIIVDDGSTDNTGEVCAMLAAADPRIHVINKANGGVGSARNAGIEAASGTYLAFLDADDTLLPETLKAAAAFFDAHYNEIDLVSYPMILYNEKRKWSHVREQILTETGVYDLTKLQNAFALITNVNVLVKNDSTLPRFREDLAVHEDELFFMEILLRKQRVGFSKTGAYRYYQHPGSAIATKMHPLYQFEKNIGFWEELFSRYEDPAPLYLQASFLNELNWKIRQDVFFPYHYGKEQFENALNRIARLMDRVCNDVIFTSPRADEYYQHYLASLKSQSKLTCKVSNGHFALFDDTGILLCRNHIEAEVVKTREVGGKLRITGILRSVLFDHCARPQLLLILNGDISSKISLDPSLRSYHKGHTQTNTFWKFEASIPLDRCHRASFLLKTGSESLPVRLLFTGKANLNSKYHIDSFCTQHHVLTFDSNEQCLVISKRSTLSKPISWIKNTCHAFKVNRRCALIRCLGAFFKRHHKPLWLYYDREGVVGGNAYLQFIHDLPKQDGIARYYATRDSEETISKHFSKSQRKHVLTFSSLSHRFMHLDADRIIASYIEHPNWCPFSQESLRGMADLIHYDIVYLQHGVLHAHMPWKYSADRLLMDYEVVSTQFEVENLTKNYGFTDDQLIKSGMPRYDRIDYMQKSERRILFAPSWRKYLVSEEPGLRFSPKTPQFLASSFWEETKRFLNSNKLKDLLDEHDWSLGIKLHPIFHVYRDQFASLTSDRVHLVDHTVESDYRIFITDFSSWVFDFVYLKRSVLYFLPDDQEFKAGLNGYRELDLPLEEGFGPLTKTADELLDKLGVLLNHKGKTDALYEQRMDGFFLHYDNKQCDRLYNALMESWRARGIE